MPWSGIAVVESGISNKTSGTTISSAAQSFAAGDTIIVGLVCDNTGTSTPTCSLNKPGGESANWSVYDGPSSTSSSGGGVRVYLGFITTTQAWSSQTITATLSEAVTAKAMVIAKMTGGTFALRGANSGTSTTNSASASVLGVQSGDIAFSFSGVENISSSISSVSGFATGGWQASTSGQGATSNVFGVMYYGAITSESSAGTGVTFASGGDTSIVVVVAQAPSSGTTHSADGTLAVAAGFNSATLVERAGPVVTATAVSSSQINLSWTSIAGAIDYEIERDSVVIVTGHTTTTYNDTGLSPSTTYEYRVRARVGV